MRRVGRGKGWVRLARNLRNLSRMEYGRPRKEVEQEIDAIYRAYAGKDD